MCEFCENIGFAITKSCKCYTRNFDECGNASFEGRNKKPFKSI